MAHGLWPMALLFRAESTKQLGGLFPNNELAVQPTAAAFDIVPPQTDGLSEEVFGASAVLIVLRNLRPCRPMRAG